MRDPLKFTTHKLVNMSILTFARFPQPQPYRIKYDCRGLILVDCI